MLAVVGGHDGIDGAHTKGTEGAWAKRPQRIQRRNDGVGILQEQAARGRKGQDGARSVERLNLELAITWEAIRALECEGEQRRERKIVRIRKVDVGSL